MSRVRHVFEQQIIELPLERIFCGAMLHKGTLSSSKFKTILSSIAELGVIEPLAVFRSGRQPGDYDLLDGRLRLEALKLLGRPTAPCMVSSDDEGLTFNRQISRLSAVHEHRMIRATLAKGASEKRIADVLSMNVITIRQRATLLDGIAPEAVTLLKDQMVAPKAFRALKKMKPFRQIEAAEMMLAANKFTATYADMILLTTRPDGLLENPKKKKSGLQPEDLARMEAEMERLRQDCQSVEDEVGDTVLSLVVANGFMARLLRDEEIRGYLKRHHADLLESLVSTMDAIAADSRTPDRE